MTTPLDIDSEADSASHSTKIPSTNDKIYKIYNLISYLCGKVVKNFILFALFVAVLVAFSYPSPGKLASSFTASDFRIIEFCNNVVVFLISGVTLKIEDLHSVFQYKHLVLYGLVSINFITTLICFLTLQFPFPSKSYAIGLTIFCCVPTTLGVGVALTQEAKGDKIMSLFMTIVSNMLGIISIPYLLQIYLASADLGTSNVHLDPKKLAYRLTLTVLAPSIVGMAARRYIPKLAPLVDKYKSELGMFSMANLMTIVWMSLSGARNLIFDQNPVEILVLFIVAVLIHLFYLLFNYIVLLKAFHYCVPMKQAISILIMASQKSSPVALSVIAVVAQTTSEKGLLTIPCVLGQIGQIFVGSIVTGYFAKWVDDDNLRREADRQVQVANDDVSDTVNVDEVAVVEVDSSMAV